MEYILQGKTLVALGDSLFYGYNLGPGATWFALLGEKYGMRIYNHGINGNTLAKQQKETKHPPMCERFADMEDDADYVVVMGGANDKRLDVPIGTDEDTDTTTFKGALHTLIVGLRAKYPKAKILFMTNYDRWPAKNALGVSDIDYVTAMLEVCRAHDMPCYDNFHNSGISFSTEEQLAWLDEGISLGKDPNHHFSAEGYRYLLPRYEALLSSL